MAARGPNTEPPSKDPEVGEASSSQSTAPALGLYMDTAARLLTAFADRYPLDISYSSDAIASSRTNLMVAPVATGNERPHIAQTTGVFRRIGGPLGMIVLDSATVTAIFVEGGGVTGESHTLRQKYDETGKPLMGEYDEATLFLDPQHAIDELTAITEETIVLTQEVSASAIEASRQIIEDAIRQQSQEQS